MKSWVSSLLVVAILIICAFAMSGLAGYAVIPPPLILFGSVVVYGLLTAMSLCLAPKLWSNNKFKSCGFSLLTTFWILTLAFPALAKTGAASSVTFSEWLLENYIYVIGFLLALSELMAVTPWFKGNGLLDTIIKSLKRIPDKRQPYKSEDDG